MLLGKSCKSRHHIKNGTLRLGTLHSYRTIENLALRDEHEGLLTFHLNFHGRARVPTIWFNTINGPGILVGHGKYLKFPGRFISSIDTINYGNATDESLDLYEARATIVRESPNTFIFCMSQIQAPLDCHGMFEGCDDYWYIKKENIDNFAKAIGIALYDHIQNEHARGNYIIPKDSDLRHLGIYSEHIGVRYKSRDLHVHNDALITLEEFTETMRETSFTKPDSFSHECEYRFKLTPLIKRVPVTPIVDSVILDSRSLLKYIYWL